jgi:hypothetical protein
MGGSQAEPGELYTETREAIEIGLKLRGGLTHFAEPQQSVEAGSWWLESSANARSLLVDRLEIAVVRSLLRQPGQRSEELDQHLCAIFPGLLTPSPSMQRSILDSYGEQQDGAWRLAEADRPRKRRADLDEMRTALTTLGNRLGYAVTQNGPLRWERESETVFCFYIIASAVIGDILLKETTPADKSIIVLPGHRAQLVSYKLERDPRLGQAVAVGWRFLKYRYVRRLASNEALSAESFADLLDLDPLTAENLQAPLL